MTWNTQIFRNKTCYQTTRYFVKLTGIWKTSEVCYRSTSNVMTHLVLSCSNIFKRNFNLSNKKIFVAIMKTLLVFVELLVQRILHFIIFSDLLLHLIDGEMAFQNLIFHYQFFVWVLLSFLMKQVSKATLPIFFYCGLGKSVMNVSDQWSPTISQKVLIGSLQLYEKKTKTSVANMLIVKTNWFTLKKLKNVNGSLTITADISQKTRVKVF